MKKFEGAVTNIISGLCLLGFSLSAPTFAPLQQDQRDLRILVRDIQGNPLHGITVNFSEKGPPHIFLDSAISDPQGMVTFIAEPGHSYIISFGKDWLGYDFIDEADQNAGAMASGRDGGFGVYLDPQSAEYFFTFVIGINSDNQLVPLYDLSRNPATSPQPFTYDGPIGDEVYLSQDVVSQQSDLAPINATIAAVSSGSRENDSDTASQDDERRVVNRRSDVGSTIVLVMGIVVAGSAVVLLWAMIIVQARQRG